MVGLFAPAAQIFVRVGGSYVVRKGYYPIGWSMDEKDNPPSFPFYAVRFMNSTKLLTLPERGAYITLLCHQWDDWETRSIPAEDKRALRVILGCNAAELRRVWPTVGKKFTKDEDGQWRNQRLEKIRVEVVAYIEGASRRGQAGAAKRWQSHSASNSSGDGSANAQAIPKNGSTLTLTSTTRSKNDLVGHTPSDLFAVHHKLFTERYGRAPMYNARDGKAAKTLIARDGFDQSVALVESLFASRDPWILQSGHGFGLLAATTVYNKLIAEMSRRAGSVRDPLLARGQAHAEKVAEMLREGAK